jgi:hypothetical protein
LLYSAQFSARFVAAPALLYLPNEAMARETLYLLLVLCIAGTSWLAIAIRVSIRRRQQSHRMERGIAEYLNQIEAEKSKQVGVTANS